MRLTSVAVIVSVVFVTWLPVTVEAQAPIPTRGRIDRTIDVGDNILEDFEFFLPDEATTISVYAQWSNSAVVVLDDILFLCLTGDDGVYGNEDDDLTFAASRQTSYDVTSGRLWYTTTIRGQRCRLSLDFQHRDQYDASATARFTIILSERDATEGTWRRASSNDLQLLESKLQRLRPEN